VPRRARDLCACAARLSAPPGAAVRDPRRPLRLRDGHPTVRRGAQPEHPLPHARPRRRLHRTCGGYTALPADAAPDGRRDRRRARDDRHAGAAPAPASGLRRRYGHRACGSRDRRIGGPRRDQQCVDPGARRAGAPRRRPRVARGRRAGRPLGGFPRPAARASRGLRPSRQSRRAGRGPHTARATLSLSAASGGRAGAASAPGRWPRAAHAQDRLGRRHASSPLRAAGTPREAGGPDTASSDQSRPLPRGARPSRGSDIVHPFVKYLESRGCVHR